MKTLQKINEVASRAGKKDGGTNIISTQLLLRFSRQEVDTAAVAAIQSEQLENSASLRNDFPLPEMERPPITINIKLNI